MPKGDRELPKINQLTFVGGESIDPKNGIAGSFFASEAMDFRQKASQMTVLPGLRTLPLSNKLMDKITAMDQDLAGVRYGVGDQGYIYRIDTSDNISQLAKMNTAGGAGIVYNAQNDQVYMSAQQTVSLFGQTQQANASFRSDNFGPSASVAPGVIYMFNTVTSSYDGGTVNGISTQRNNLNTLTATGITPSNYASSVTNTLTNTTKLPTMLNNVPPETVGSFCAFIPDIEPFYGVAVWVTTIGTGDWTLTMHDSLNNNLGAVTITHANVTLGWNLFHFADPGVRAFVNAIASANGATGYHFHLTSSSAADTAAVATINAGDFTGTNFVLFAHRLVATKNGWHPMCIFNQYLCIGNGNYLSVYNFGNDANPNNQQWVRHMLFLDVGMEVTGLTANAQNLIITAEKRSTSASRSYQGGYMYTWDGINSAPNQKIPVTMGAPYAPYANNNVVYMYCAGSLYAWGGGTSFIKVRYIAYQNTDYLGSHDSTIINPNMMDTRYGLLLLGYPSSTTNQNFDMGIYSWGSVELSYPNSYGFSYALANGKKRVSGGSGTDAWVNLQIGMIKNFVDTLYTSWQYTDSNGVVHYGLDIMDNTSDPAPSSSWSALLWDGGAVYKTKQSQRLLVSFLPLPEGVTITGWYNIDRQGEISVDPENPAVTFTKSTGAQSLLINVPGGRCREIQVGFTIAIEPGSLTPTIIGVTSEVDPLPDEDDLREYITNGV
jgi:hypothetical protein